MTCLFMYGYSTALTTYASSACICDGTHSFGFTDSTKTAAVDQSEGMSSIEKSVLLVSANLPPFACCLFYMDKH